MSYRSYSCEGEGGGRPIMASSKERSLNYDVSRSKSGAKVEQKWSKSGAVEQKWSKSGAKWPSALLIAFKIYRKRTSQNTVPRLREMFFIFFDLVGPHSSCSFSSLFFPALSVVETTLFSPLASLPRR